MIWAIFSRICYFRRRGNCCWVAVGCSLYGCRCRHGWKRKSADWNPITTLLGKRPMRCSFNLRMRYFDTKATEMAALYQAHFRFSCKLRLLHYACRRVLGRRTKFVRAVRLLWKFILVSSCISHFNFVLIYYLFNFFDFEDIRFDCWCLAWRSKA